MKSLNLVSRVDASERYDPLRTRYRSSTGVEVHSDTFPSMSHSPDTLFPKGLLHTVQVRI